MVVNDMLFSARKLTSQISRTLRGFTLIELLVVIGILGVLAAAALVAINPAEAQKKARDTQRLKDMATVQSIVEQFLNDNPGAITVALKDSSGTGSNSCSTGWLSNAMGVGTAVGADLCKYANVIPVDPVNRSTSTTTRTGTETPLNAYYFIVWSGHSYKICTRLESRANAAKLINDGEATANDVFSVFSLDTGLTCPVAGQ